MAYSDLLSNARLVFTFDNTNTYTVTGTTPTVEAQGTGSPIFVADAPAGIGATHSVKTNGYSTSPTSYRFRDLERGPLEYFQDGIGKTFTAWVKLVPLTTWVSGTTALGGNTRFWFTQNNSGTSQQDYFQLNGGTYNEKPYGGSDRFMQWGCSEVATATSTLSGTSGFGDLKVPINEWFHIAFISRELPTYDLYEKIVYVNGICVDYSYSTGRAAQNQQFGTYSGIAAGLYVNPFTSPVSGDANVTRLLSNAAFWQYPLTKEEIRAQAWYNHNNEDYQSLVLADNPTYYATLDNPDKATDHTVLGTATSWGPLSDDVAAFYVNEQGPANTKAWRNISTSTQANNYANVTDPDFLAGLPELYRTGEFSIEFWAKFSDKPSANKTLMSVATGSPNYQNGYFEFRMDNVGRFQYQGSYKSGATTWLAGSILGTSVASADFSQTGHNLLALHPGGTDAKNWADNEWHHIVYTQSNTDSANNIAGSYFGVLFVDGAMAGNRSWTNTYGWADGTGPITQFYVGSLGTSTTLRDSSVAEIAFYPRRLSDAEIRQHFIAGKDYVTEQGAVKYYDGASWINVQPKTWNGTAWVDWVKKYWNGTSWVDLP